MNPGQLLAFDDEQAQAVALAAALQIELTQLRAAGVRQVWSSDAVPHEQAVVPLAGLIAGAVQAF